jgi:REP element-mobilizing transposase RayT
MSYISILVHCVWTTNRRIPFIKDEIRNEFIFHILETSRSKNIHIDHINGYYEHLHALISLGGQQNISDIMHQIKGESSFWINKNKLTREKFSWQDDFYAVSIGMPQLENLRGYIRNQPIHHIKISWDEELSQLEKEYKIVRIKDH